MLGLVLILAVCALVAWPAQNYVAFRKNLQIAKSSGLPYVTAPVFTFNRTWGLFEALFFPVFRHILPEQWIERTFEFTSSKWVWRDKWSMFEKHGDMFLIVSPGRIQLYVANAEAIDQITTRRNDFPKPLEFYGAVDIFGKNVVSTEGAVWRHHRKITSPSFNEKNNRLVWDEALKQASAMVGSWMLKGDESVGASNSLSIGSDTMRLSLHVISKAGFDQEMLWPFEEEREFGPGGAGLPNGHELSYTEALATFLRSGLIVLILPAWLLARLPFDFTKKAYRSFVEWSRYQKEIFDKKKAMIAAGKDQGGLDLMGALIRGANVPVSAELMNEAHSIKGSQRGTMGLGPSNIFGDQEILGNAFVFLLAGHETVANTLHYAFLLLAMNPLIQRDLQQSLDDLFGERPVADWDYDKDLPRLYTGMTGAVMNEELRLVAPVTGIPKSTPVGKPQRLSIAGGRKVIVPADCFVALDTPGLHRNPAYWPRVDQHDPNDLVRFKPQRWFRNSGKDGSGTGPAGPLDMDIDVDVDDTSAALSSNTDNTTSNTPLFQPVKGSYIPFSEGARSCLGRRFAQVEALAVIAFVLKYYSFELDLSAVDPTLSKEARGYGERLKGMSSANRSELWRKTRQRATHHFENSMVSRITLQMQKGDVPVRLVIRGREILRSEETVVPEKTIW